MRTLVTVSCRTRSAAARGWLSSTEPERGAQLAQLVVDELEVDVDDRIAMRRLRGASLASPKRPVRIGRQVRLVRRASTTTACSGSAGWSSSHSPPSRMRCRLPLWSQF